MLLWKLPHGCTDIVSLHPDNAFIGFMFHSLAHSDNNGDVISVTSRLFIYSQSMRSAGKLHMYSTRLQWLMIYLQQTACLAGAFSEVSPLGCMV